MHVCAQHTNSKTSSNKLHRVATICQKTKKNSHDYHFSKLTTTMFYVNFLILTLSIYHNMIHIRLLNIRQFHLIIQPVYFYFCWILITYHPSGVRNCWKAFICMCICFWCKQIIWFDSTLTYNIFSVLV